MKKELHVLTILLFPLMFGPTKAFGEEQKTGWLREKIKARLLKKLEDKPAPEATASENEVIRKPGDYLFQIEVGKIKRYYKIHVPKSFKTEVPQTVIFSFHGGGGNMEIQSNDEYYGLISSSESENYVAVFPNGVSQFKSGELAAWNAGNCCGFARDEKIDDVGFVRTIVERISKQMKIDPSRIFATGMSNGGMFVYRLACEASDIFRAVASIAGTDGVSDCHPKKPVSILHIHAKDDDHVLFNGGAGEKAFKDKSKVAEFISVPDTIANWKKRNSCTGESVKVLSVSGAYCEKFEHCSEKSELQLCVTDSGGHSWPGGKKPRGGAEGSKALSANTVIWNFFKNQK